MTQVKVPGEDAEKGFTASQKAAFNNASSYIEMKYNPVKSNLSVWQI